MIIDQSAATGFVGLGEFDFAAGGDEHVQLAAAGDPGKKLVFDAIRVTAIAVSDGGGMLGR